MRSLTIAFLCAAQFIGAQEEGPSSQRPATAAERSRGNELSQALGVVSDDRQQLMLPPAIDSALQQQAHRWLASLPPEGKSGIQLDPLGSLLVTAGQDALANSQFERRLATPKLSENDRVYTLILAVRAFGSDASNPTRMQSALRYLGLLDAMPVASSIAAQFEGHRIIGEAYYQAGDNSQVIAHLTHAFSLLPRIPFIRRNWLAYTASFLVLSDVLSGMPEGRRRIDSLTTWMRPFTLAPAEQLASDSTLKWTQGSYQYQFDQLLAITRLLGRPAPPIRAHFWINTAEPSVKDSAFAGAEMKTLADGKIRVIEYGHYGCPGCIAALPKLERLKQTLPKSVEIWMSSDEGDVWGATPCTPPEMAQHLTDFYVTKKKYTIPIAVWIGSRTSNVDGGTIMDESPTSKEFQFFSYPTFAITDGRGIIRRMVSPYSEAALMRTIRYLLAEQIPSI